LGLGVADMILSKEELSVQVADFNIVIIGAMDFALRTTSNTHQSKSFNILATKSSSTNHECINFSEFFLYFTAENLNLIVVSAVCRCSVNFACRNSFKDIIVKPLL
jgi:hypothetical protein